MKEFLVEMTERVLYFCVIALMFSFFLLLIILPVIVAIIAIFDGDYFIAPMPIIIALVSFMFFYDLMFCQCDC